MPTLPAPLDSIHTDARHATINNVGGHQYVTYMKQSSGSKEILASLKPVDRSGYYVPPCMEGTREIVLKEIWEWLDDGDAPNVLWLNGCPGAGKSAIASSLVSRLIERRRLGSSFFFKRGDFMLSDPAAVWRTVAFDLAQHDPNFANNLLEILDGRKVLHKRPDVALHFKYLIEIPLTKSYNHSRPWATPVVVIDGIDECNAEGPRGAQRRHFLHTLGQWSRLSRKFKMIIAGRDERNLFEPFRDICRHITLPTGDGVGNDTSQDVRRFFAVRLAGLEDALAPNRPWQQVLDVLTARTAGLFIWADTVVKFVEQGLPVERLELALDGDLGGGDNITKLYQHVLQHSFPEADGRMLEVFRLVVGTIVTAKRPIHYADLKQFVLEPDSSIKFILDKLSSVISISNPDKILRIGHSSFSEFISNAKRCPYEFLVNRDLHNMRLAVACFRLMKDGLKFNICGLNTSYMANDDVEDLPQRMETNISPALLYACRFWAAHLRETTSDHDNHEVVIIEVKDFFYTRLLFWLEVMSLNKEVLTANVALLTAAHWIQVSHRKQSIIGLFAFTYKIIFHRTSTKTWRTIFKTPVALLSTSTFQFRKVPHTSTYPLCHLHLPDVLWQKNINHSFPILFQLFQELTSAGQQ